MPCPNVDPIELARERLTLSRTQGVPFVIAWGEAVRAAEQCKSSFGLGDLHAVLTFARPHFKAAYLRLPAPRGGGVSW